MDGLRITQGAPLGDLHRINVADEIADGCVRRRKLLAVALAAMTPGDGSVITQFDNDASAVGTHRGHRVVVHLGPLHDRSPLVQESRQSPDESCLALPALTEQHEVVTGEECPLHLGQHGVIEADDARERGITRLESGDEVGAHLLLDGACFVAAHAQRAEGAGQVIGDGGSQAAHVLTVRQDGPHGVPSRAVAPR